MAVTDKINLSVKRNAAGTQNVTYAFRIESFDANVKTLSNYRIRCWFDCHFGRGEISLADTQQGQPFGGSIGNPNFTVTANYFDAQSGNPPRIATTPFNSTPGLWNVCLLMRFTTGTLDAIGEGYQDMSFNFRHTGYKNFERYSDGTNLDYETSYSKETGTVSYQNNATFVLEYNDIDPATPGSSNWTKVTEVTDSGGTVDTLTGVYPYGNTWKDDTKTDHTFQASGVEATLQQNNPTTIYNNEVTTQVYRQADVRRALMRFNIGALSGTVVKASMYNYMTTCLISNTHQIDFHKMSNVNVTTPSWNERVPGVAWNTPGGDYDASPFATFTTGDANRTGNANDYQDAFIRVVATAPAQAWLGQSGAMINHIIKYNDESQFNTNQFNISTNNAGSDPGKHPFLVVAGIGTQTAITSRRRIIIT